MLVYFIRHGSTDSLEQKISQPDNEPLNQLGQQQAKKLGQKFSSINPDLVITSPHLRALQTAQAINPNPVINDLFFEVRKPKEVIGQSKDSQPVKDILKKIGEMYLIDSTWHYSDEENFEDLKSRAQKALSYLSSLNHESLVVVSHGNFIALMTGLMLFGSDYPVGISLKFKNFFRLSSAGVSIFEFIDNRWRLLCWNDTCHL